MIFAIQVRKFLLNLTQIYLSMHCLFMLNLVN